MKTKTIKDYIEALGLETYNDNPTYICIKGINGGTGHIDKTHTKWKHQVADHIHQMGRDSLKMELHNLLCIMSHH